MTSSTISGARASTIRLTQKVKKFFPVIFLAGVVVACATTGQVGQVSQADPVVTKIRAGILKACGFEIALPVLQQIINSLSPGAAPFTQLANQAILGVCQQVTSVPAAAPLSPLSGWFVSPAYAQAAPQFNGVVIRGQCKVPARGCKR